MALNANALTTLATVKEELSLSSSAKDVILERLINVVSQSVEQYLQRKLYSQTGIVETVSGYGGTFLHVVITPLDALTSITFDGVTVASSDYEIHDADSGAIYSETGWRDTAAALLVVEVERMPGTERRLYTVTYDGGFVTPEQGGTVTLPLDLEDAVIQSVVSRFRSLGRDGSVSEEKLESWSSKYGRQSRAELSGSVFPPPVSNVLDQYKRAVFA